MWKVKYRGRGVEGVGWEGVVPYSRGDVMDLRYRGFWWGIIKAWRRMGAKVEEEDIEREGIWNSLRVGEWRFDELSLKKMTGLLHDWKGSIDIWPLGWQRKNIGENWHWQRVWQHWKKMQGLIPSKMWVVWWRVLRRNVMLRNRTGWWAENRGCQFCSESEEQGVIQSPEHLMQECSPVVRWWSTVDHWAGWSANDIEGRRAGFQFWMIPGKSVWQNVGKVVAWWVLMRWHWAWVFDKVGWPGEEVVMRSWREEMEIVLSGLMRRRPKVWEIVLEEAGERLYSVGGRVYLDTYWGQGKKGRPREHNLLIASLGEPN